MFYNSKSTFYLGLLLFITGLFYSCAQIGNISGGLKDSIPPVMIYSQPVFADTSFNDDKLKLTFDEYFVLEGINEEFISSPPLKEFPEFKNKKHSLIIELFDTLITPVTYVFNFGNAIADLNEKNVLENFRFVFSTGSMVDSFSIAGRLKNAFDLLTPENALVMVYHDHNDSIPYLSMPNYLSKIDSSGNFSIDFIKEGGYKIFALQDLNGNLMMDPMESLAFLDSIIIPQREIIINIDSLKAGTILHDVNDSTYRDSLERDTVIITERHFTTPDNIFLYMFAEKRNKQRLTEYSREKKGKINLTFDIPISDSYQLTPLNFNISEKDYLLEVNPEKDSLLYWYKDTAVQAIDTLQFELKYKSVDSLDNPTIITDTVYFEYREKKDSKAWKKKKDESDTIIKIEYLNFTYKLENDKLDLKKNLSLETEMPLLNTDTSLIKLYEIRDTSTVDTKEQKIVRAVRTSENRIFIEFLRPIINKLNFEALDFKKQNWYLKSRIDSTTFSFRITDEEQANSDTLNLVVNYDNLFFLGQIQELSDTIKLGIVPQRLKAKKRDKDNRIELAFDKPLTNFVELFSINFPEIKNAFNLKRNKIGDSLKISTVNNKIRLTDTLKLSLKSLDYVKLNGDSVFYADTITLIYREKKQYLSHTGRTKKHTFKLTFNKSLIGNVEIEPQNFTINNKWFELTKNKGGDTLSYTIIDDFVSDIDTLNFVISYQDKDRKNRISNYSDSLILITGQQKIIKEKAQKEIITLPKNEAKLVNIYVPVEYNLEQDSNFLRTYHITTDWLEDTKYRITTDSMAYTGYFKHFNKYNQYEFSTRKKDYYALLNIKISKLIPDFYITDTDSITTDSLTTEITDSIIVEKPSQFLIDNTLKVIGQANFILQLINEKDEVFKEYQLKQDAELEIGYIIPGKYILKLIYDRNNNGKWDTGNYLKKSQAERVLIFPKELGIAEGLEINMEWDVGKQLIKSMQEGD
ncbi:MAG: Ig-like domain-containing protein [Bacteroidota bacterium]